ncbi:MAG: methyltransferase domain-containing protein [Peptococcaceae bacterium]|nr:methyltransferase domain-containing protein [Peptococcaceae bacterium]
MSRGLGSAVHLVHLLIAEVLGEGGTAVDATAGNGRDTLFLARLVGPAGRVYAFDVQERALRTTRALLEEAGLAGRVTLVKAGHEEMERLVPGPVDAVVFNLGYLPGGDHALVTRPDTTVRALRSALNLLRPGGRAGLVVYTGHPGGREECRRVEELASRLDGSLYRAIRINFLNRAVHAPVVIVIDKAGAPNEGQAAAKNS